MEYRLLRKKRKTVGISISQTGEVLVYAPLKASTRAVDDIVKRKEKWIAEAKSRMKTYQDGDKIIFFGKEYRLKLVRTIENELRIKIEGPDFTVYHCQDNPGLLYRGINDYLYNKYREDFKKGISVRIRMLAAQIGVVPNKITVKNQKTIWGSCSRDNNISINFKLALAPLDVVDYILIHELCHIIHKNHSREFWMEVESYIPDYRKKRNWLKASSYKALF